MIWQSANRKHFTYMNKLFKYDKAVNSILFSLSQLGGVTDMHKLCKILYFADQRHLSAYGRSITGDTYIAMQYGPVPSNVDDILKAVRGDSFFASCNEAEQLRKWLAFDNHFMVRALVTPNMNKLSVTDVKCLTYAIDLCRDKSFEELTRFSHGLAWNNTQRDREMSVKDILREVGEDEAYVEYIADKQRTQSAFL